MIRLILILVAAGAYLAGCGARAADHEALTPNATVGAAQRKGRDLILRLNTSIALDQVITVERWATIKNDPSQEDLQATLGIPPRQWTDVEGSSWSEYQVKGGAIQAGLETQVSGWDRWKLWRVYFLPHENAASKVFASDVAAYIDEKAEYTTVVIETSSGADAAVCEVWQGRVKRCRFVGPKRAAR